MPDHRRPLPAGDFPEGLPTDKPILYVKAGSSGGGSKEAPLGTISEAVKAAGKGAILAIGKGVYPEAVAVGAGKEVTLWGACAREVVVQGPEGEFPAATVLAQGSQALKARLVMKNVTIKGDRPGVHFNRAEGKMEGVVVSGVQEVGIGVLQGRSWSWWVWWWMTHEPARLGCWVEG
jgi:hypothetical protein